MKLLYATGNQAKFAAMQRRVELLGIELCSLNDMRKMGFSIPKVEENGTTPLENARIKARDYYETFRIPVFSCDSGLYFEGEAAKEEPGVHVRTIDGNYLSDEQVQQRMVGLTKRYGRLIAHYKHAICLILDDEHVYEAMDESTESKRFYIVEQPHPSGNQGFPIDSLSVDIATGKYYYDLPAEAVDQLAIEEGVVKFFEAILDSLKN